MTSAMQEKAILLERGRGLTLENIFAATVRCTSGRIWLTQYGDSQDYVLAAGDELRFDGGAVVVIEALEAARFCVCRERPAPPLFAGHWRQWPLRLLRRALSPRWRAAANARHWMLGAGH